MAKKARTKKMTKDFWGKLSYWQRGSVIGVIAGIVYYLYLLIDSFKNRANSCSELFSCVGVIEYLISFVPLVAIFFIYGGLMGWILEKLIKKNKKTANYIFLIILIISFIILYYWVLVYLRLLISFLFNPPY